MYVVKSYRIKCRTVQKKIRNSILFLKKTTEEKQQINRTGSVYIDGKMCVVCE